MSSNTINIFSIFIRILFINIFIIIIYIIEYSKKALELLQPTHTRLLISNSYFSSYGPLAYK